MRRGREAPEQLGDRTIGGPALFFCRQGDARLFFDIDDAELEAATARPPFAFATFFSFLHTLFVDTRRVRRYNAIINEQRSF